MPHYFLLKEMPHLIFLKKKKCLILFSNKSHDTCHKFNIKLMASRAYTNNYISRSNELEATSR